LTRRDSTITIQTPSGIWLLQEGSKHLSKPVNQIGATNQPD